MNFDEVKQIQRFYWKDMGLIMSRVNELHQSVMDLAEGAALVKLRGEAEEQQDLLRQALDAKIQAAALLANQWAAEPSRSVIYRSVESLALQCSKP